MKELSEHHNSVVGQAIENCFLKSLAFYYSKSMKIELTAS